jgi:hypothetical protein
MINNNSQSNIVEENLSQFSQLLKDSNKILNLGGSLVSKILNKKNISFSEIKLKSNLNTSDYLDKLSVEKLWSDELEYSESRFDLIILNDILEQVKYPDLLLDNLSNNLSDNGSIIVIVRNFLYIENMCKLFSGTLPQNNFNIFDLDSLNLFLNHNRFVISELYRNQIEFDSKLIYDLNNFDFPTDMLNFLKRNPESKTVSYIIRIKKKILLDIDSRQWSSKFPKNYFLEQLKNKFDYYEQLEQTIKDKDDVIKGLEKSLNETKSYLEQTIKDKDDVIKGLEKSLNEYKEQINKIKNSKSWKLLHKFDKNND